MGLQRGLLLAATPLEHALLERGLHLFKDWYFAEGGREGETKLLGNKPPDARVRREQLERLRGGSAAWLEDRAGEADELMMRARERARATLAGD